jgi:hypothetical protein
MAATTHDYKTAADNNLKNKDSEEIKGQEISITSILNETVDFQKVDFKIFPYLRAMRITETGSFEGFESTFKRANMETLFPFTNLFIQVKDQISNISSLKHIISFTNRIAKQLDRRILREEAISQKIRDFLQKHNQSKELSKEFEIFQEAWNQIKNIAVRYNCKEVPPIEFKENSELISLLPSDSIEGGGLYICAAFQRLADIQNDILLMITSSKDIDQKYPYLKEFEFPETFVQDATPENLIDIEMKTKLEKQIQSSSYPGVDPGRGKSVIYNWKGAEEFLRRNFLVGKRKINSERIRMVQFKGELSTDEDTDIIRMIRVNIPQKLLSSTDFAAVMRYLESKQNDFQFSDDLHTSLLILLSYSMKIKLNGEITFEEACKKFRLNHLPHDLAKDRSLKDTKICNVVQIFEFVEDKMYPIIEDKAHHKFKKNLTNNQMEEIGAFIKKAEEQQISLQTIVKGVKRFIGRYLDEILKELYGLKDYLGSREGLWPIENYDKICDFLENNFPSEVLLENSISLVKYILEDINKKQEKEEEASRKKQAETSGLRDMAVQSIYEGRNLINKNTQKKPQQNKRKSDRFDG